MNRVRAVTVVFVSFAFASVATPPCLLAKDELPKEITETLSKAEWKAATELLRAHLDTHSDDAEAWYELGRSLFLDQGFKEALAAFQSAFKLLPEDRPTAVMLARTAAELGDFNALEPLSKSFSRDPDILFFSGVTALKAQRNANQYWGQFDARFQATWRGFAVESFTSLAAIDPNYPGLDSRLGYSLLLMKDEPNLEKAAFHLQRAAGEPGAGWEDSAALAECLTRLDLPKTAEAHWTEAKRRGGNATELEFRRARALREMGRSHAALEGFKRVFAAQGDYPSIRHEIGIAAFDAGDFATALWAFGESRRLTGHPRDEYMIGRTAYAMGDDVWAEMLFSSALASLAKEIETYRKAHNNQDPDRFWMEHMGELQHYLGRAQLEIGKRAEAIVNLEAAWQGARWNKVYRKWLFGLVLEAGDHDKAMELAEHLGTWEAPEVIDEILAKWPADQDGKPPHRLKLLRKAALANFQQSRFAAAMKGFTQVAKESPGEPPCLEHVWSAMISGDFTAAETLLKSVLQTEPQAQDEVRVAQALLLLRQSNPGASADAVKGISGDSPHAAVRDAILLHAGIAAGHKDLPKADPFTALGIVHLAKNPTIVAVLPGSPAERAGVLPGDRLYMVGNFYFYPAQSWKDIRSVSFPGQPVNLDAERLASDGEFIRAPITLDYGPLLSQLGLKPDPNSAFHSFQNPK